MHNKNCPPKSPRFTRKGVRISPKLHWARMVVYTIMIPIVTWYGHQQYTNPFRYHSNVEVLKMDSSIVLSLFETNYKDSINRYLFFDVDSRISSDTGCSLVKLSCSGIIFDEEDSVGHATLNLPGIVGTHKDGITKIIYNYWSIVIPTCDTVADRVAERCDILIINSDSYDEMQLMRSEFAPRITIWNSESNVKDLPNNIVQLSSDSHMRIVKSKKRRLVVEDVLNES